MFFSMMNMGRAYVTETGRLIGVVGLKELRDSITNADAIMEAKRQGCQTKIWLTCHLHMEE